MTRKKRNAKSTDGLLPFRRQHGGRREGAGRKPTGKAGVSHDVRAAISARLPVHVTVKLKQGLPRLRRRDESIALRAAFHAGGAGVAGRGAFRLRHYAVLDDHLHFLCEAQDRRALSRGLQGLLVRIARALNKLWARRGKVFADRYHDRILETPQQTRNAMRYVLANGKKHAAKARSPSRRRSTHSRRRRGSTASARPSPSAASQRSGAPSPTRAPGC